MAKEREIKSKEQINSDIVNNMTVIGTFTGKCADYEVTNENGMQLNKELWENIFASQEYKDAIKNKWYIGYLGHPEDCDCMDFKEACIVMTDCQIDENTSDIIGTFDLIDTPVGRIVKSFIDAGVHFGISVRGFGDIENGVVDPDTFVFRGFDLVTFPAYTDAVPEFEKIAASTDTEKKSKYKKVCASIEKNIDNVTSATAIDVMQSQFAGGSKEYKKLEDRKEILEASTQVGKDTAEVDLEMERLQGLTELYLESVKAGKKTEKRLQNIKTSKKIQGKRLQKIKRITGEQTQVLCKENDALTAQNRKLTSRVNILNNRIADLNKKAQVLGSENEKLNGKVEVLNSRLKSARDKSAENDKVYNRLTDENERLKRQVDLTASKVSKLTDQNRIYSKQVETANAELKNQDDVIASLKSDGSKTVKAQKDLQTKASNLDEENNRLKKDLKASQELLAEYQEAYAELYAGAIGVNLNTDVVKDKIKTSTTPDTLQSIVSNTQFDDYNDYEIGYGDTADDYTNLGFDDAGSVDGIVSL